MSHSLDGLVVVRESLVTAEPRHRPDRVLRRDELTVDDHVELALAAGLDVDVDTEAFLQLGGQTGRARLVASGPAVQDLDVAHFLAGS